MLWWGYGIRFIICPPCSLKDFRSFLNHLNDWCALWWASKRSGRPFTYVSGISIDFFSTGIILLSFSEYSLNSFYDLCLFRDCFVPIVVYYPASFKSVLLPLKLIYLECLFCVLYANPVESNIVILLLILYVYILPIVIFILYYIQTKN